MSDNGHGTPKLYHFGGLMFGDRFRFAGDPEGSSYATVKRTQKYADTHFSVDLVDGTSHYGSLFRHIILLHRAPYCDCGRHVDLCENDCPWPKELEDLWQSMFTT